MKRLYADADLLLRTTLLETLESRGIPYVLRNQFLAGAVGELPPTECCPEVWVIDDRDLQLAQRLLKDLQRDLHSGEAPSWCCPDCGERLEPAFELCWRCGADRPAPER